MRVIEEPENDTNTECMVVEGPEEELPSVEAMKKHYKKEASNWSLSALSIFKGKSSPADVVNKLRLRAENNPGGASSKTIDFINSVKKSTNSCPMT